MTNIAIYRAPPIAGGPHIGFSADFFSQIQESGSFILSPEWIARAYTPHNPQSQELRAHQFIFGKQLGSHMMKLKRQHAELLSFVSDDYDIHAIAVQDRLTAYFEGVEEVANVSTEELSPIEQNARMTALTDFVFLLDANRTYLDAFHNWHLTMGSEHSWFMEDLFFGISALSQSRSNARKTALSVLDQLASYHDGHTAQIALAEVLETEDSNDDVSELSLGVQRVLSRNREATEGFAFVSALLSNSTWVHANIDRLVAEIQAGSSRWSVEIDEWLQSCDPDHREDCMRCVVEAFEEHPEMDKALDALLDASPNNEGATYFIEQIMYLGATSALLLAQELQKRGILDEPSTDVLEYFVIRLAIAKEHAPSGDLGVEEIAFHMADFLADFRGRRLNAFIEMQRGLLERSAGEDKKIVPFNPHQNDDPESTP